MVYEKLYRRDLVSLIFHQKNKLLCNRYMSISNQLYSEEKSKSDVALKKYEDIPISNIRNFSIIAHIDHGKSTLADRLLEITGTVNTDPSNAQLLDRLQVERERGITVKAVTASLQYASKRNGQVYLLNLVDTPGHVDFSNEVSRALAACQSVILLVDANQGVQAQTFANFYLAFMKDLVIVPVLNKIDLKNAKPEMVEEQLQNLFDIEKKDVLRVSAKTGLGVEELLEEIIERTPPPSGDRSAPFKALLFDSWFEPYRGVIALLYVQDGEVKEGDEIVSHHTGLKYTIKNVGIVRPNEHPTKILKGGQVGYVTCNMKSVAEARLGDTFYMKGNPVQPFPGIEPTQPLVFAGLYPADQSQHVALRAAIEKLSLTDSAVTLQPETSPALGHGFRIGFLGLLHLEVFSQRLEQEYNAQTIMTAPSVTYKVKIKGEKNIKQYRGENLLISNPSLLPNPSVIVEMQEPMVLATIMLPSEYIGDVTALCMERRGVEQAVSSVDNYRTMLRYRFPLSEIIVDFNDKLKNLTSGFASFNYEDDGYEVSDLIKVDFLLNGQTVEELSMIVHKNKAREKAREVCLRLTEVIPRQQFLISVQAAISSKIIARENIKPYRKDVGTGYHGGDATRKMRIVKMQTESKKRMRLIGKVEVPRDAFVKILKR